MIDITLYAWLDKDYISTGMIQVDIDHTFLSKGYNFFQVYRWILTSFLVPGGMIFYQSFWFMGGDFDGREYVSFNLNRMDKGGLLKQIVFPLFAISHCIVINLTTLLIILVILPLFYLSSWIKYYSKLSLFNISYWSSSFQY